MRSAFRFWSTRILLGATWPLALAPGTVLGDALNHSDEPLVLTITREGSGTAWQPDSSPGYGHHFIVGDWRLMLHYNALAGYDYQSSRRGDEQLMSVNWIMLMADHELFGGQLIARTMLSAEPFTTGGKSGYPLLLQTGEEVGGIHLHDRQHPHDLFMEVALKYTHALTDDLGVEAYLAPSGEPALGPVAFPHRPSASSNPFAPLGHHWQDSSHIAFGVLTLGFFTRQLKLEGSWFNGREPDENRYDFDLRAPDSVSLRLSYNPSEALSFQVSYGHLASPEELEPLNSVNRLTGSATYNRRFEDGNWATTAVLGHNIFSLDPSTSAALLESNFELTRNTVFGRVELLQRTGKDLLLAFQSEQQRRYWSGTIELGYLRDLVTTPLGVGVGAVGSVNFIGSSLRSYYGTSVPVGGMIFLRLRPPLTDHSAHGAHAHHHSPG